MRKGRLRGSEGLQWEKDAGLRDTREALAIKLLTAVHLTNPSGQRPACVSLQNGTCPTRASLTKNSGVCLVKATHSHPKQKFHFGKGRHPMKGLELLQGASVASN